ncbi:hypothetical protein G9A89_013352 [Geosiphon pyriformis]|nr:hypothetical protein G9A89_013352 [Geosiphon pyriformis]
MVKMWLAQNDQITDRVKVGMMMMKFVVERVFSNTADERVIFDTASSSKMRTN